MYLKMVHIIFTFTFQKKRPGAIFCYYNIYLALGSQVVIEIKH